MLVEIFWVSAIFVLYIYAGYPFLLWLESIFCPHKIHKKYQLEYPRVSVVIAAKNEEQNIKKRLENICEQSYLGSVEVIVVSDGSHDQTCSIIKQLKDDLVQYERRKDQGPIDIKLVELLLSSGKATALNKGIDSSSGEIVVFTDSRQTFEKNAVKELLANFSDPQVGAVSGELIIMNINKSEVAEGMGLYWLYEKFIRKRESLTGSVVGATGAIYAIRRHLFQELPENTLLDDVLIPLNVVFQGYRVVFDSEAKAYDITSPNMEKEWKRKVRTLSGNWQLLSINPNLLIPWKNPILFRFLSHKICRLLVPYALFIMLLDSLIITNIYYNIFAVVQLIFYLLALAAFFLPGLLRKNRIIKVSYFFVTMNMAAVVGLYVWVKKKNNITWK